MSQSGFAASLGITQQGYSLIEAGKRKPSAEFLAALYRHYHVPPEEIITGRLEPLGGKESAEIRREWKLPANLDRGDVDHLAKAIRVDPSIRHALKRVSDQLSQKPEPPPAEKSPLRLVVTKSPAVVAVEEGLADGWLDEGALTAFLDDRRSAAKARAELRVRSARASSGKPPGLARAMSRPASNVLVPLVRIAAGIAIESIDPSETGEFVAPPPWLENEKIDVALRIVGDSMTEEGLRHDDTVFVRRKAWSSGGIAVARRVSTNEITLKQVFARGAELELRSASERAIAPMRWPADDSQLHGVEVVGMWRPSWHGDDSHSQ